MRWTAVQVLVVTLAGWVPAQGRAWTASPGEGTPVCLAAGYQSQPVSAPDGAGGAIIAWLDRRGGDTGSERIYAQRLSASGEVLWGSNGVAVCTTNGSGFDPVIVSDGSGGAVVAWEDQRAGSTESDIYAQRIDGSGATIWPESGVPLCTATATQRYPRIAPDRSGGAIVVWEDHRVGPYDIYAQRVNGSGVTLWGNNGLGLCTEAGYQGSPVLFTDSSGTAFFCWSDGRAGSGDLYAQKVDPAGTVVWNNGGVQICNGPGGEGLPVITPDEEGGFIAAWFDTRSGSQYDIYAQRVNSSGVPGWLFSGVPVATTPVTEQKVELCGDGAGGAILAWYTFNGVAGGEQIYAQRLDGAGVPQWRVDGIAVCTAPGRQEDPMVVADGLGGAIIGWADNRSAQGDDVYAQRVDRHGRTLWPENGAAVATAIDNQRAWKMTPDGRGGVIISWADNRLVTDSDIYATFLGSGGSIGVPAAADAWSFFR